MMKKMHFFQAVLLICTMAIIHQAHGQTGDPAFVRWVDTGEQMGHLDTSIQSYRHPAGREVHLVAAIHVADAAYYRLLNEYFAKIQCVLYEMVKDEETHPTVMSESSHPVSQLQSGMKALLGLTHQLDEIDYTSPRFVHADLDPETFAQLQGQKGESFFTLAIQAYLQEKQLMARGQLKGFSGFDLLMAMGSGRPDHALKWMMARQMTAMESMLGGIDQGMDGKGSVILRGRNDKAFEVLAEQFKEGKRQIAIFYGAGHMPDMHQRLIQQGFIRSGEQWLTAWDLKPSP